jgi:hypothetical protein
LCQIILFRFLLDIPQPLQASQSTSSTAPNGLSFQEAVQIEQDAHAQDFARQEKSEERKRRLGLPIKGEKLSRQEMEARMWAFMYVS